MARYTPLAGFYYLESPGNSRCTGVMSDTTWGGDIEIYNAQTYGMQNGMTLQVKYGDETWTARTGAITIPEIVNERGAGEFDVTATNDAGETLRVRGPIDFCNYVSSEDCPYGFDASDLPMDVAINYSDDAWGAPTDTYATDCRAVIDTATGGLQVDLQLGVWKGRNISLYQVQCDMPYSTVNSLRFRSGAVTGPGQYGPWATSTHTVGSETYALPELDFQVPLVYYGFSCLSDYDKKLMTYTSELAGSACEFSVTQGDPLGSFELSCTDVQRGYLGQAPENVDLSLETPCVVITQ